MSYGETDTIDWQAIREIDIWLDDNVSDIYKRQPLAQDWARITKVGEERGESIGELILLTGQNPRKPIDPAAYNRLLMELADVAITAICALQHFTKDEWASRNVIKAKIATIRERMLEAKRND